MRRFMNSSLSNTLNCLFGWLFVPTGSCVGRVVFSRTWISKDQRSGVDPTNRGAKDWRHWNCNDAASIRSLWGFHMRFGIKYGNTVSVLWRLNWTFTKATTDKLVLYEVAVYFQSFCSSLPPNVSSRSKCMLTSSWYCQTIDHLYKRNRFQVCLGDYPLYLHLVLPSRRVEEICGISFFWYLENPPSPDSPEHWQWVSFWQIISLFTGATDIASRDEGYSRTAISVDAWGGEAITGHESSGTATGFWFDPLLAF